MPHQHYRQVWHYLRYHPINRYITSRFLEMEEWLTIDTTHLATTIRDDPPWKLLYQLARDKSVTTAPELRCRLLACIHRYEQLRFGSPITAAPSLQRSGEELVKRVMRRSSGYSPEQAKVVSKQLLRRLMNVR